MKIESKCKSKSKRKKENGFDEKDDNDAKSRKECVNLSQTLTPHRYFITRVCYKLRRSLVERSHSFHIVIKFISKKLTWPQHNSNNKNKIEKGKQRRRN